MAGANPAMVIKVAASIAELKKNLAEGASAIQVTTAGMQKLAASLDGSKLEQRAHNITAAIHEIGGASKLSDAEARRLLPTLDAWIEKGTRLGKEIPPGILQTRDALQQMAQPASIASKTLGDLGDHVKATALGFVSAQAIIGAVQGSFRTLSAFVGSSVESYASAEAAARKMTTALQAQGTATPAVIGHFNDLASQFQRTTVYSDDLINEMQALLTSVGDVAPAQMAKALTAATNLASGLGIDLHAATMMVAKASEENIGALKKSGVALDEARVKGEGMSYILGEINAKFGGQAASEIETYAGKVKQLANEWDNFKEAVGRSIVEDPALQALLSHLKAGVEGVGNAAGKYTPTITEWWAALQGGSLAQNALTYFNTIEGDIQRINAALAKTPPPPKAFEDRGDPFAKMMADAKAASDALIAQWKKEDVAAQQHATALAAVFNRISGADASKQMRLLDEAFRRLAASGQLTEKQIDAVVQEALKLQDAGGKMTQGLWDMVRATNALSPGLSQTALDIGKIGTHIDLVIPKLDKVWEKLNAPIPYGLTQLPGVLVSAPKASDMKAPSSFWGSSEQFGQQLAGTIMGAIQGGGNPVSAAAGAVGSHVGTSIAKSLTKEGGKLFNTALGGVFSAALPVIGSLIGPLTDALWGHFFGTKGRDSVKDFAQKLTGSSDLNAMNTFFQKTFSADEADKYWKLLTQQTGRNNAQEAATNIGIVTAAIERQKAATSAAAQAIVENAAVHKAELDAIAAQYDGVIGKLKGELGTFSAALQAEADAPEFDDMGNRIYGVVELQQMARKAQLDAEIAAAEIAKNAEMQKKQEQFDEMLKAGQTVDDELRTIFAKPLEIPYYFRAQNLPGGLAPGDPLPGTSMPGGVSGGRQGGSSSGLMSGQALQVTVISKMNEVEVGRGMVRVIPGLLTGAGR